MGDHDEWLDAEAAGRYLNLPTSTIYRLIQAGQLDARSWPVRIRREALDECLERCRIKPGALSFSTQSDPPRSAQPRINRDGTPDRRYGSRYSAAGHGEG